MRALALMVVAASCLAPATGSAQQWSPEQQEVWDFELGCQESKQAWIDCFHEDYVAWGDMTLGVPHTKADASAMGGYWWDTNEQLLVHMKPVEITVRGDLAVVLVVYTARTRDRDSGEVAMQSMAWTDICVKENGRWYWIADHGAVIGGS